MSVNIASFYNILAPFYFIIDWFFIKQKKKVIKIINILPAGELLDIGIGTGSLTQHIQKHTITGIDASTRMLKFAKKKLKKNTPLYKMDASEIQFDNDSFDYTLLTHVLSTTETPQQILNEAIRVTKKNGKIFILNHFTPKNHLRHMDQLFNPIAAYFKFQSYFNQSELEPINKATMIESISFGPFNYYQLIILKKNEI